MPIGFQVCAALALGMVLTPAFAGPRDLAQEQQATLNSVLTTEAAVYIAEDRAKCASGQIPSSFASTRLLGAKTLPDPEDYCITVLIRAARDGALAPLRDNSAANTTPAVALDTGFVAGYKSQGAATDGLPDMPTLKPVAARCLAQTEPRVRLCYSAGYAFGVRAAHGEVVRVR